MSGGNKIILQKTKHFVPYSRLSVSEKIRK
jgi:hypothetical protein